MQNDDLINDLLNDSNKISKSGVREIFTPHTPISNANYLKGRESELEKLFNQLITPGQHALIYGERGIGKSSLAEIASSSLCTKIGFKRFVKRCSKSDSFATIFEQPLANVGIKITNVNKSKTSSTSIGIKGFGANYESRKESVGEDELATNPSYVADKIANTKGLLVIDEFDAIQNDNDKFKIAEVIKLLSDQKAQFKILIVGIAESAKELTVGHPSVSRCLIEIKVPRMKLSSLIQILINGFNKLNLRTANFVNSKIAIASCGYPYFTHLLALKLAEKAILLEMKTITVKDLEEVTSKAIEESEEFLRDLYEKSVDRINREKYEKFLLATATCRAEGFTNAEIRHRFKVMYNVEVKSSFVGSYLKNLADETGEKILKKTGRYHYRFSDPRMASFVKICRVYFPQEE